MCVYIYTYLYICPLVSTCFYTYLSIRLDIYLFFRLLFTWFIVLVYSKPLHLSISQLSIGTVNTSIYVMSPKTISPTQCCSSLFCFIVPVIFPKDLIISVFLFLPWITSTVCAKLSVPVMPDLSVIFSESQQLQFFLRYFTRNL